MLGMRGDNNGTGNRQGIAIEICYSKSGGDRFNKAERNAAELIAQLLKERGWGIDKVTKHQDYSKKYCPHRTLDLGWQRFLDMISAKMIPSPIPKQKSASSYTTGNYKCLYNMKVRDGVWGNHKNKNQLSADGQRNCIAGTKGTYKAGTIFTARQIINHTDGSVWAVSPSGYICIKDKNQEYCKKC